MILDKLVADHNRMISEYKPDLSFVQEKLH